MLSNLLAIKPGDGSYWAGQQQSPNNFYFDNFGEAALYALIGFVVVFIGIAIIIGIIWLVGLLMRKTNNLEFLTKKREKTIKKSVENSADGQNGALSSDTDDVPDEVKAAIVAAIMAYYEEREEKCQFTVKRIKRM